MNSTEFTASLLPDQSSALNAMMVEQRNAINAMRDTAMTPLSERAVAAEARADSAEAGLSALTAKVAATTAAVKSAYDANDIPAMLVIAADFVTPEQEKERLADIAQAADMEAQAAELRAKYEEVTP